MFSETASVHPPYTLAYLKATQNKTRSAVEDEPASFLYRPSYVRYWASQESRIVSYNQEEHFREQ